jgi:NADH-quinone oxidoreductase subunit G
MAKIYIEGKPYEVEEGRNLLQACLSLGFNVPYFCWHPAMGSVGACRQCAVKQYRDEKDTHGKIVMSCMTPAEDGIRISIDDPEVRAFRASVIEWLMMNHPHDCPICDEGGECHLQDMTVMTGHNYRRYRFRKRTHRNQNLGPFVNHEMNRCIQCYRCVRFYRGLAGGRDFNVFASHDHVYFGRHGDGVLENEFSGNLVEICPTGVFTDKTLKEHYTRKWDLQTAPSVCVHCAVGCNTLPGERYGVLRRIRNRYHHGVNGYFLCDRGRYGYAFVNSDRRIRQALVREESGAGLLPASREAALDRAASFLSAGKGVIGIGSPRAPLEANFALRQLVGPERFCLGLSQNEHRLVVQALEILEEGPARVPSLRDAAAADVVLVLGEDVTNTAPMLAFALRQRVPSDAARAAERLYIPRWNEAAFRQVVQEQKATLFHATPYETRLDEVATRIYRDAPDGLARLGFAVAAALADGPTAVPGLTEQQVAWVEEVVRSLKNAERPLVVSGTGCGSVSLIQAAANVAWALCARGRAAHLSLSLAECNTLGLGLLGGKDLDAALQTAGQGEAETLVILENDLYRRATPSAVEGLLRKARHVIVIDHLEGATCSRADVVLPAATFAEAAGTLVSQEGRAQRVFQVFLPAGHVQASWRWIRDLMTASGRREAEDWRNLDDLIAALAREVPRLAPIAEIAPPAGFRLRGSRIPRQAHRYTGRTAMRAHISVHEPKQPEDPDSALAYSMEGYEGQPPGALNPRFWAPGWNSVQALNKFQDEVGGPLRGGDPGRRLIEPSAVQGFPYFREVPGPLAPEKGTWLVVPMHHIFGSEELSMLSPGIADRAPQPHLAMNRQDAECLQVADGDEVELALGETVHRLRLLSTAGMPRGLAGIPAGLPGFCGLNLPALAKIRSGGAS